MNTLRTMTLTSSIEQNAYEQALGLLTAALQKQTALSVAVSGGVDSLTLAAIASRYVSDLQLYHAASPAVPAEAAQRLTVLARERDWQLTIMDAGELQDARYRANPVNRCFYCKQNLYQSISSLTAHPIASGTNLDDLSDFRPGLEAAAAAGVIHPFVDAGFSKAMVRKLAASLGLTELATLPASPCLSSRVLTGVPVEAELLSLIDKAEQLLKNHSGAGADLRCRVSGSGLHLQLSGPLPGLNERAELEQALRAMVCSSGYSHLAENISWGPYLQGSAFIRETPVATETYCV